MWTPVPPEECLSPMSAGPWHRSSAQCLVKLYSAPCLGHSRSVSGSYDIVLWTDDITLSQVGAGEVWSDEAIARFSDLVTGVPVKADIVSAQAMGLVLQLHVRYIMSTLSSTVFCLVEWVTLNVGRRGEEWTDVLGLLVSEGFAVDEVCL